MEITNTFKYLEKFEKEFQKYLSTLNNKFYLAAKGTTGNALSVNIPQTDTLITSATDVTSPFAEYQKWVEDNKVVTQQTFRSKVSYVDSLDTYFTAQDTRQDCIDAIGDWIDTEIGNFAAYKIAATGSTNIIFTSGSATTSSVYGSTQAVKKVTKADMLNLRSKMMKSKIVGGKWILVMDSDMIQELFDIPEFVDYDKTGALSKLASGESFNILGMEIVERNAQYGAQVAYTVSGTTATKQNIYNVPGGSGLTGVTSTMVGSALLFNTNAVYTNKGYAKLHSNLADTVVTADRYSVLYTFGIEPIRKDWAGVYTLVQGV